MWWSRLLASVHGSSRLTRSAAVALLLAIAFVLINAAYPVLPWALLWLPAVGGLGLVTVAFWRTSRADHLPAPTRRFWRHVFWVAVFVTAGQVAQAVGAITADDLTGRQISLPQQVLHGIAILLVMYALFRLPFGRQTRGELFRVVLDAGTVMLGCAVFVWHFQTRQALRDGDRTVLYVSITLTVLALLAVFAFSKFVLTSHAFIDRGALRLIGVAVLIGAVGPTTRPFFEALDPHLFPDMIDMPGLCLFGVLAAARQLRSADHSPRRGIPTKRRRSFSLLPYLAVGAVDALLLTVTWAGSDDPDARVVVASAVVLTAVVLIRQITSFLDNGRLLQQLDHSATHDALTELPNRALFHERLNKALSAPGRHPVAVALIDLDDFKEVNDTLGHEIGDTLLIAVAHRLAACLRVEDTVARLGGDEFVVVLDGADAAIADQAARRMIEALREPVLVDGHELPIRASIGIADGGTGDDPSLLLRQADIAMYAAKHVSGTAFLHFETDMAAGAAHLEVELRNAIADGQLFLLYQPIVGLADGRVLGAEALVRWAHPEQGTLAPDAFLPLAERSGLIVPLTRWVLHTAITQLAEWPADICGNLNINISARDLREPGFADTVAQMLAEAGVPAHRITLEITESTAVEPGESVISLEALRGLGVRISLDDFGTGHSTLTLLHDCPVDEVKLDRSFTQAAPDGRVPVAAALMHLATALNLHAVAEGVETAEQTDRLRAWGYQAAQGYHFARPMPADRFRDLHTLTPA